VSREGRESDGAFARLIRSDEQVTEIVGAVCYYAEDAYGPVVPGHAVITTGRLLAVYRSGTDKTIDVDLTRDYQDRARSCGIRLQSHLAHDRRETRCLHTVSPAEAPGPRSSGESNEQSPALNNPAARASDSTGIGSGPGLTFRY
jgi:hypothetical protein